MRGHVASFLRRLFCLRHEFRPSTAWPGVIVCRRCGFRKAGEIATRTPGDPSKET